VYLNTPSPPIFLIFIPLPPSISYREPGEWALERAKLNVNENFLLVGILEELEDVLLLLERFLPHYFKDVLSIYKNPGNFLLQIFHSHNCWQNLEDH